MSNLPNQRDSKRVAVELKGNYRIWESDFPYAVITTVNISHTGICFRTDKEIKSGDSVELKIVFPENEALSLLAKVIWSNPIQESNEYSTGVQIMNVNSKDAVKFKEYYEQHLLYPPKE